MVLNIAGSKNPQDFLQAGNEETSTWNQERGLRPTRTDL